MLFACNRGSLCFFVYNVGIEPTVVCAKYRCPTIRLIATYDDVLPQLIHTLLEYRIQHTKYLLSRGLLSRSSRPVCMRCHMTTNHSHCGLALGSDPSDRYHYPFSYPLASWFCCEVGTTRYFPPTLVPLRASRSAFFPQHLLHSYIHRSYQ